MGTCAGVDVSKHHLDWVSGGEGNVVRVLNTPAGIRRLITVLRKLDLSLIVVESLGRIVILAIEVEEQSHEGLTDLIVRGASPIL